MINKPLISIALIAACAAVSAEAAQHNQGGYIEGNLGTLYASVNLFHTKSTMIGSFGANANGGYLFTPNFAMETGYTNYGLGLNNVDVAAKFILPFTISNNDFSVFAKVGPAYTFDNSGQGQALLFGGVGGSYALTDKLDLNLQAQGVTIGFFSLGLISTGLDYHFD